MSVDVIVGYQRGDEGKGRFVDMLAEHYDIVARYNGGSNAGHTVVYEDHDLGLHQVPCGVTRPDITNVIGNGMVIDPGRLVTEITSLRSIGLDISPDNNHKLMVSSAAHLVLPHHIYADSMRESGSRAQGSTKAGISPAYASKAMREGVRAELIVDAPDELFEAAYRALVNQNQARRRAGISLIDSRKIARDYVETAKQIGPFIADTTLFLNQELRKTDPARVLAEGAQAYLLDIDHGMYPDTTSSSTISGGVCTGLGISPHYIGKVTGVAKAIQSHVGGGHFVTEIHDPDVLKDLYGDMDQVDSEKGTTTGRIRRLGNLDLPGLRRAQMVNGSELSQEMALTKLDWVRRFGKSVLICTAYEYRGEVHEIAPDSAIKLRASTPIYEELPSWDEDIQDIRNFDDLPTNAQGYIKFIQDRTGVPITMIGVGPRRNQVIIRN